MKYILFFVLFIWVGGHAQTCPPEGLGGKNSAPNKLKNRASCPDTSKAILVAIEELLHDNVPDGFIKVDAYIVSTKISGLESCECKVNDPKFKDSHTFISSSPDAPNYLSAVVESTRYSRVFNPALTFEAIKKLVGHRVRVYGYSFMDSEHKNAVYDAKSPKKSQWRSGIAEVHPVFYIKQID